MKLKVIITITVVVVAAICVAFLTTITDKTINPVPTLSTPDTSNPPIEVSKNDNNGWTKINIPPLAHTTYSEFSISYPSTWSLDSGNSEGFVITKGNSTIEMSRPVVGGGVCLFTDTDLTMQGENWREYPIQKTYKEIVVKHGLLRRYKLENQDANEKNIRYQVCERYTGDKFFEIPLDGGVITVTTPKTAIGSELNEIDTILATYKY